MSESLDPYRLPRTVLPTRYELTLEPDLPTARFAGRVVIMVEVVEPVEVMWLNAAELAITAAAIEDATGQQRPLAAVTLHESAVFRERVSGSFSLSKPLRPMEERSGSKARKEKARRFGFGYPSPTALQRQPGGTLKVPLRRDAPLVTEINFCRSNAASIAFAFRKGV